MDRREERVERPKVETLAEYRLNNPRRVPITRSDLVVAVGPNKYQQIEPPLVEGVDFVVAKITLSTVRRILTLNIRGSARAGGRTNVHLSQGDL